MRQFFLHEPYEGIMTHDTFGDRCKHYEMAEAGRAATPGMPLLARLDGRAFHSFTRGLSRPFDERLSLCMIETTKFLIDELHAQIGYTQSDEISLLWYVPLNGPAQYPFNGRYQKLASVLAGLASAKFIKELNDKLPEKSSLTPCFDSRVWQVPTLQDALDVFIWREDDAIKNSISMAASAHFSDRQLHGKHSSEKREMLAEKGIQWNDYPVYFKRGTYLQRQTSERTLSEEERLRIPEAHRPSPEQTFLRSAVNTLSMPPIRQVSNALAVIFEHAEPIEK